MRACCQCQILVIRTEIQQIDNSSFLTTFKNESSLRENEVIHEIWIQPNLSELRYNLIGCWIPKKFTRVVSILGQFGLFLSLFLFLHFIFTYPALFNFDSVYTTHSFKTSLVHRKKTSKRKHRTLKHQTYKTHVYNQWDSHYSHHLSK